jgi:hypothetical protein
MPHALDREKVMGIAPVVFSFAMIFNAFRFWRIKNPDRFSSQNFSG